MRVLILRGGGAPVRQETGDVGHSAGNHTNHNAGHHILPNSSRHSTRSRGVIALGNGSGQWVLINMSPAVAHQLDTDPGLQQHPGLQGGEVRAVVLTDAQVDHVSGLLSLRDGPVIDLYATPTVFEQLTTALPVLPVLQHYCGVHWRVVPVAGDLPAASFRVDGLPTLEFTAVATQALQPPHLAQTEPPRVGDSIALAVRDLATGQRLFCAPGLAQLGDTELDWMREADCLLLDAPLGDAPPWLATLRDLPARHKVLFCDAAHPHSLPSRPSLLSQLADSRISLAHDGMEIAL